MKAVMKTARGVGHIEVRDIPEPEPASNEVKIKVIAAGICGTDIHIYYDEYPLTRPPVVMGHEVSGEIVGYGKDVKGFKVGDLVTSETYASVCGKCRYCRTGNPNLCPERRSIGSSVNGVFTKYLVIRKENVHKLPPGIDINSASLCEPLACCVHGIIEDTHIDAGDTAVISGPGPIGLLSVQIVKAEGGIPIVLGTVEDKDRLQLAKSLGAELIINVEEQDPIDVVNEVTNGYGADVVLECAGKEASAKMCLEVVKKMGKYTQMGLFGKPVTIDFEKIAYKELKVTGFFAHVPSAWERALKLLEQERINLKPIVSHIFSLTEWGKAFKIVENHKGLKVLLQPVD